jgi:DNA-directed RNA polymerase specialized sigma24 family protein
MADLANSQHDDSWVQEVDELVKRILCRKLAARWGVSPEVQDLYQNVMLHLHARIDLIRKSPAQNVIRHMRGYAASVTEREFANHMRSNRREWYRLKTKIPVILRRTKACGIWEDDAGEEYCGLVSWRNQAPRVLDVGRVGTLKEQPWLVLEETRVTHYDLMTLPDWEGLLTAIFKYLDGPVPIDTLTSILAPIVGANTPDRPDRPEDEDDDRLADLPDPKPAGDPVLYREMLRILWATIVNLTPDGRRAYLLNPTGFEIETLHAQRIVSIRQIGRTVDLSDKQYELLWSDLPLSEKSRLLAQSLATRDEKFAMLWTYLPLRDSLIARLLGVLQQRVINLRAYAREQLMKAMREHLRSEKTKVVGNIGP